VLAAALATDVPIVALHLTRPAIELPDREELGMASHFEAARGAYVLRPFHAGRPKMGTVFVQGTTSTANLVRALPELDARGLNVKVVAAISPQLFRMQPASYRDSVITDADRLDAMAITNRTYKLMRDWVDGPLGAEYSMAADWDNRWRTGGTVDEVMDEAHLTSEHIIAGIERFANDRESRLERLRHDVSAAERRD
jgi:transketolase